MILNGWKEIAAHLGRGVRTAQRWEKECGLPVRRPRGTDRSAVLALSEEIDAWTQRCSMRDNGQHHFSSQSNPTATDEQLAMLKEKLLTLTGELHALAAELRRNIESARTKCIASRSGTDSQQGVRLRTPFGIGS